MLPYVYRVSSCSCPVLTLPQDMARVSRLTLAGMAKATSSPAAAGVEGVPAAAAAAVRPVPAAKPAAGVYDCC